MLHESAVYKAALRTSLSCSYAAVLSNARVALSIQTGDDMARTCRYFPYKNDAETVPRVVNQFIEQAQKESGMATQAFTQAMATQNRDAGQEDDGDDDVIEVLPDDNGPSVPLPVFEVFWQVGPCTPSWCIVFFTFFTVTSFHSCHISGQGRVPPAIDFERL